MVSNSGKVFNTTPCLYLLFFVEVAGLSVVLVGFPVAADNIDDKDLMEHNNLQEKKQENWCKNY